ncbi:MAG: hypothetical protein ACRELA_17080, partial [Candidatus Rokuibacteriota bacterium]
MDPAGLSPTPAGTGRLKVLLMCDYRPAEAAMVWEHIEAFSRYSAHEVWTYSGTGELPAAIDLAYFDAIIIHYSLCICRDVFLAPPTRYRLRMFRGLKALFIQDEYRFIDDTIRTIQYLGIDVLFTAVPEAEIERVYPRARLPHTLTVNVLTGYISEALLAITPPPLAARPVDVGYRGRKYPAWHGTLGLEKWQIAERFLADAEGYGLRCDISYHEKDRLYGQAWIDFLCRSKAQLGVESGASVMDFTGEIARRCEAHERRHPDTPYALLRDRYFAGEEGKVRLNQIAPRIFEGLAMKCLMILYEGEYSGILVPGRHYVPLKKDHSNVAEVVAVLRDLERAQAVVDRAFREVVADPRFSYRAFVAQVDRVLVERLEPGMAAPPRAAPPRE